MNIVKDPDHKVALYSNINSGYGERPINQTSHTEVETRESSPRVAGSKTQEQVCVSRDRRIRKNLII